MTPIQLQEARNTYNEIERLRHLILRLELGDGFGTMKFIGNKNNTMGDIEAVVKYPEVLETYKKCLEATLAKFEGDFEKM
jgi:hypothetical protein